MKYCPRCGKDLIVRPEGGRDRSACPDGDCRFVHFGEFSIGVGGVVMHDDKVLLIRRGHEPGRGWWQLPGGYAECDEAVVEAVEPDQQQVGEILGQGPAAAEERTNELLDVEGVAVGAVDDAGDVLGVPDGMPRGRATAGQRGDHRRHDSDRGLVRYSTVVFEPAEPLLGRSDPALLVSGKRQ